MHVHILIPFSYPPEVCASVIPITSKRVGSQKLSSKGLGCRAGGWTVSPPRRSSVINEEKVQPVPTLPEI